MFPFGEVTSEGPDSVIPSDQFKMMTMNKFCVKRFFEIGFINSSSMEDENFVDHLVALNKTKQETTHVTFIDKPEVEDFMEDVANEDPNLEYPPPLLQELKQFVDFIKTMEWSDTDTLMEYEAYKMKFKLIHTMYLEYANCVREMRRQDKLARDLDMLAERKTTARSKRSIPEAKSAVSSRSGKRHDKAVEKEDFTEVDLMHNDLVVDDLAKNQVIFYIFRGFNNVNVIKHLLKIFVKISFIIKVSQVKTEEPIQANNFWNQLSEIRSSPFDYLQNIAVFKYRTLSHIETGSILEECLAELIDIVKQLIDLKRLHFNYIKNLKMVNTKFTETFRLFPIYNKIMDQYPLDTTTIPLLMNSMLQEVQMKQDKHLKSQSFPETKPKTKKPKRYCPFDIRSILGMVKDTKSNENKAPSFKIYEKDNLNVVFKSYENIGVQYLYDNLSILKLQKPITLAERFEFEESTDDFCSHTHDVVIPCEQEPHFTNDQTNHLINLLYLKNRYFHEYKSNDESENELTKNVVTFDNKKHVKNLLPHCLTEKSWRIGEPFKDPNPESNQYEALKPMSLHWAEMLKPEVLLQYLMESELKFLCCDYIPCPITNSLILRYHNNVNSFGLNTKIWNEYLRTPVGLGDFCKFTLKDDYDWLKMNKIFSQITYLEVSKMFEEHSAFHHYRIDANRDYRSLLVPQIQYSNSDIRQSTKCPCIEENVCKILESCNAGGEGYPEISTNLESILKDLEEYNNVVDFSEHCKSKAEKNYSFATYNFGVSKFSIIGHTTDFISLDQVRVTIDTSRFSNENFKMMIKVSTDHNMIVVHIPQNRFSCQVWVSDGTIVVFSKPAPIKMTQKPIIDQEDSNLTVLGVEEAVGDMNRNTQPSSMSFLTLQELHGDKEITLTAMDFEHYISLNPFPEVGSRIRVSPKDVIKTNMKKDVDLLRRLQQNTKYYKVSRRKARRNTCIQSKTPETEVALSSVVKRFVNKRGNMEFCEIPKRKCVLKNPNSSCKTNSTYDCVVTVPNGLTVRVLPSEQQSNEFVIKQSYEFAPAPEDVSHERYRMFTHDGSVIVGQLDGSIHLLMSSGREIIFTKPTNAKDDEMFCKFQKNLTEELIRKLFARMMAEHQDPKASEYFLSRRSHIKSKYASIEGCESLVDMSKLPFSTVSMITLEGEKITLKNKKLYKYQHSRYTTEFNFLTEERYFRRDDGFFAKIDRDGTQYVHFPDRTMIRTISHMSEETIRFSKKDQMGWTLITSTYLYEHPIYKPVFFDNIIPNIEIQLNSYDTLNINAIRIFLDMKKSTSIDLKTDFITYTKNCKNCGSKYTCSLFIEPLYQSRNLEEEEGFFVHVEDSYKKTFKADFRGNCKVDPNYISTTRNEKECEHFSQTDHQKVYLIRKNLEGMVLWNDKSTATIIRTSEENKKIQHFIDSKNKLKFLTITKNVFTKFNEKFFGKSLKSIDFPSAKNDAIIYLTTRNFYSMFEMDQIDGLMKCLKKFYKEETTRELVLNLGALKFQLSATKISIRSLAKTHSSADVELNLVTGISLHDKLKEINRNLATSRNIMKMSMPKYFNSKFCTFIDEVSKPKKVQSKTNFPVKHLD